MTQDLKTKLVVDREAAPVTLPCSLCGEHLPHHAVGPLKLARLCYRATVMFDRVWLPVGHSNPLMCPDPPAATASFWSNDIRREGWKREHRARMEALRVS